RRTLALWLASGVLVGAIVAGVVLWLWRRAEFEAAPCLQATSGPYRATLVRVAIRRADGLGAKRLYVEARIERADGGELATPAAPWSTEDMAVVFDGAGQKLSTGEPQTEDSRTPGGGAYELRRSWALGGRLASSRKPSGPLYVTVRFPGEVKPDAAAPLSETEGDTIVQAANGSASVLVRSVQVVESLAVPVQEPGPCLVVVFADAGRIRGSGPMPAIRIAVRDAAGQRMDNYREWLQDAARPDLPRDLCRAYPIAGRGGPFTLELTSDETYRQAMVEFTFEPVEIK
ncbi:MAG: hypothetical protein ACE5JM_08005, partial [Armatimonadota bacterium]